jgi:hypothetical protein
MIDQLRFHDAEKRLGHGIIPTVPLARHALDESLRIKFFTEIRTGVLDPAIRSTQHHAFFVEPANSKMPVYGWAQTNPNLLRGGTLFNYRKWYTFHYH